MKIILGLSSFTFGWSIGADGQKPVEPMTEVDLIQHTLDARLSCLQLGDNLAIHTFSPDRLEALRSALKKNSIRFEIGARKLTVEHLQRYLHLSVFFNSPLLRFVIDGDDYEPDSNTIVSIIKDFLPQLEKQNIILGIENHDRFKAKELASIMDRIDNFYFFFVDVNTNNIVTCFGKASACN